MTIFLNFWTWTFGQTKNFLCSSYLTNYGGF